MKCFVIIDSQLCRRMCHKKGFAKQEEFQSMRHTDFLSHLMMSIYRRTHVYHKKHKSLISRSKEIGLEVNAEKAKYIFMTCEEDSGKITK